MAWQDKRQNLGQSSQPLELAKRTLQQIDVFGVEPFERGLN